MKGHDCELSDAAKDELNFLWTEPETSVNCQQLTAVKDEESSLEGSTVTLTYKYSKAISAGENFFWYQQHSEKPSEFLMHISGLNISRAAESLKSAPRFSTKLSGEKHLELKISSAAVSDSVVYYCAVRPTVTGNNKTLYKNLWSKDNRKLHNIH
uniref:Ig-like domain-containing protein n=1 Tax=Amphiprion percula TaxID=161767 RepID=A0A3P8SQJ7_AMPPE